MKNVQCVTLLTLIAYVMPLWLCNAIGCTTLQPVRWTAPEAIDDSKYSEASDVWSFAITVVEIIQNGGMPYPGMSNPAIMDLVTEPGFAHPQPPTCSEAVYGVLMRCWARDPVTRPTFVVLSEQFLQLRNSVDTESNVEAASSSTTPPSQFSNHSHNTTHDQFSESREVAVPTATDTSMPGRSAHLPSTGSSAPCTPPDVDLQTETRYGTVVENTSPYGTPIERSTSPLQLGRSTEPSSATPGTTPGSDEEIYAAAPEEMLGWTKPLDVMSIYEDVGRPNVIPSNDGDVYARGKPANEPSDGGSESTTPYGQSVSVESVVGREVRALTWQEPAVLSGDDAGEGAVGPDVPNARGTDTTSMSGRGAHLPSTGSTVPCTPDVAQQVGFSAAREEMLDWRKPMDAVSTCEDVGRPNMMLSADAPAKESSEMRDKFARLYNRPFTVESAVRREAALHGHNTGQVGHTIAVRGSGGRGYEDKQAATAFGGGRLSAVGDVCAEPPYSQPVSVRSIVGDVARSAAVRSGLPRVVSQVRVCVSVTLFPV